MIKRLPFDADHLIEPHLLARRRDGIARRFHLEEGFPGFAFTNHLVLQILFTNHLALRHQSHAALIYPRL
jgi:hypothetical protein